MMKEKLALSLTVITACAIGIALAGQSEWNQEARDFILDLHNEYRRNEGGCQINKLEYDQELENQAKTWAEGCDFKHEYINGRGENLAFRTYSHKQSENDLITSAAKGWFDEKDVYTVGQSSCSNSCHYTQMVWDTTEKVGCYSTRCSHLASMSATDAWYFVCFYSPKGNFKGQEPYETSCDTPCRDGQTEEDGLCVSEIDATEGGDEEGGTTEGGDEEGGATEGGDEESGVTEGGDEEGGATEGVDEEGGASEGGDEEGGATEGVDEEGGATEGGDEEGGTTEGGHEEGGATEGDDEAGEGEGEGEEAAECVDNNENCLGWAATNQCSVNAGYMSKNCRASCKVCEGGKTIGACDNKHNSCEEWAEHGHCKLNPGYMLNKCRKACGAC